MAPGGKGPRSLRCEQCDRPDPLKAGDVSGWLKGEYRPVRYELRSVSARDDAGPDQPLMCTNVWRTERRLPCAERGTWTSWHTMAPGKKA